MDLENWYFNDATEPYHAVVNVSTVSSLFCFFSPGRKFGF